MKKTLLALAALAATSAAFAQSSVTLYGVMDVSLEKAKGDHQVTRVTSGNLATSRLGVKGTEDLGGGMKTNFVLESAVSADTGANGGGTTRFFDRAAWVGLQGGAGELRLGRQDSSIGILAGDSSILGAQAYDDLVIVNTRAGKGYRRVDNAVTYLLPTMVEGVSAQLQYSTTGNGQEQYGQPGNYTKNYGLNVKYAQGPVFAGLGYLSVVDDVTSTAGNQRANATLVYGGYDLGTFKAIAYYDGESALETSIVSGNKKRLSVYGVKAIVPVTADITVQAGVSMARNIKGEANVSDNAEITAIKAIYKLSKRTSVYGLTTMVNNSKATTANTGASTLEGGHVTGGVAVGIAHAF